MSRGLAASRRSSCWPGGAEVARGGVGLGQAERRLALAAGLGAGAARAGRAGGRTGCAGGTDRPAARRRRACRRGRSSGRRPASRARSPPRCGTRGPGPRPGCSSALGSVALARTARRRASSPSSVSPSWKQRSAKNWTCSGLPGAAASRSRPASSASSRRPSRASSLATLGQVLGPRAAVERGEPAVDVGRVAEPARRLVEPRGGRPGGDRVRRRARSAFSIAAIASVALLRGLEVAGQPPPGGGVAGSLARRRPSRSASIRVGEPLGRLVGRDLAFEHGLALLLVAGQPLGRRRAGAAASSNRSELEQQVGVLEPEVEVVGVERAGLGDGRDRLVLVAEPGEHLAQPAEVPGVPVRPGGDRPPGGQGVVGPLQRVIIFAEVLAILGRLGGELDGLLVERDRLVGSPAWRNRSATCAAVAGVLRPRVDAAAARRPRRPASARPRAATCRGAAAGPSRGRRRGCSGRPGRSPRTARRPRRTSSPGRAARSGPAAAPCATGRA